MTESKHPLSSIVKIKEHLGKKTLVFEPNFNKSYFYDKEDMDTYKDDKTITEIETVGRLKLVGSLNGIFRGYDNVVKITGLDLWDTSQVTDMSFMFYGSHAKELDLSSFDTSQVTDMTGMFMDSKTVIIKGLDKFNTSRVKGMMGMFKNSNAKSIIGVGQFDMSNVMNIYHMFFNSKATELGEVNFNVSNVSIEDQMFKGTMIEDFSQMKEFVLRHSKLFIDCKTFTLNRLIRQGYTKRDIVEIQIRTNGILPYN